MNEYDIEVDDMLEEDYEGINEIEGEMLENEWERMEYSSSDIINEIIDCLDQDQLDYLRGEIQSGNEDILYLFGIRDNLENDWYQKVLKRNI